MQRARILRPGISTVRKRCVVSGVELRASRLAWTHPRHKSTEAESDNSFEEPPRVRSPVPEYNARPRTNTADAARNAAEILRGGSGTVLDGILSRIEGRRQRLERLAEQSILYKNPFKGDYTAGHVFTPGPWHQNLEPGDLICCGKQREFGIVVNVYNAGFTIKAVILTVTRSLVIVNQNATSFCIKQFVPRKVAEACLVPLTLDMSDVLLTSGNVFVDQTAKRASLSPDEVPVWIAPLQIAEQVCKIIRHFQTEAMALHASLMPMGEKIHRELSAQDESKIMSLFDIANYIRPQLSFNPKAINIFYFAVHTLISGDTIRWQTGSSVGYRHLEFAATSRTRVEQVERAIEYVRDINGDIARSFIKKCVKLIKYYRKFNKSDSAEINAAEQPRTTFSDSDQAIIRMIMLHLSLSASYTENQMIFSLVGRLLREIDMWGDSADFAASTARQLLYEIGVLPRWVDLRSINVLDGREVADLSQIVYKNNKDLGGGVKRGEGKPKLELKDRMEEFRHDFGDLPVYCIDGPGAEEIDDGISIEAAEDGATWVHVHIANPTAFFHKDDEIITRAASRWETIYLNEGSRPLLPAEVVAASGLRRPEGEAEDSPRPVLTFSIKLDANVEIIDYAVRPSHVRNIKSVTYEDLSEDMNWNYSLGDYGFPQQYELPYVDNTSRNTGTARVLSESDKQSLQLGFELAEKVRIRRARAGAQTRPSNHLSIAVNENIRTVFGLMETTPSEPSYEFPTPDANMRVYRDVNPASYMVSEFMLLAGRVATMYAAERNIQLPFRHGQVVSSEKLVPEDYTRAGFLKSIYPKSFNPSKDWYDIEPGPSADLGIHEGYARVTSPLRRYLDMVAHFQLEASIRGEDPVYTRDELEKLIKGYLKFQASGKILKRGEADWTLHYLDQLKQQSGLKLTVIVMSNCLYPEHTPGFNIDYGIPVSISCDRRMDLKIGDYIVCDEVEESNPLLGHPIVKAPSELTPKTRYEFAEHSKGQQPERSSALQSLLTTSASAVFEDSQAAVEREPAAVPVAAWQPDGEAGECPICRRAFTMFYRRHHCRICGRVVCGVCSANFIPYPPGTYSLAPGAPPEPAGTLLRTCEDCIREPAAANRESYSSFPDAPRQPSFFAKRPRARSSVSVSSSSAAAASSSLHTPSPSTSSSPASTSQIQQHQQHQQLQQSPRFSPFHFYRPSSPRATKNSVVESTIPISAATAASPAPPQPPHRGFRLIRREADSEHPSAEDDVDEDDDDDDDEDRCPICGRRLSKFKTEEERETHVNDCLTHATFSGSPEQARRRNRMVVYKLPESQAGKECVICFEEFQKDDLVARLECLCVYHRKCIRAWFEKKGMGECPIHAVHT